MCLRCHSHLSDDDVLSSLKLPANFENWNTTSLSHHYFAASGANGEEARKLALERLEEFLIFLREKGDFYVPTKGLESFGLVDDIASNIFDLKNITPELTETTKKLLEREKQKSYRKAIQTFDETETESSSVRSILCAIV